MKQFIEIDGYVVPVETVLTIQYGERTEVNAEFVFVDEEEVPAVSVAEEVAG